MRSLLQLLGKYSILLMFMALEALSLILIVKNNEYQRSSFFSSSNAVAGWSYAVVSSVADYFHLGALNRQLREQNNALMEENNMLKNRLEAIQDGLGPDYIYAETDKSFISAKVINITTGKKHNHLTINKGERDSVGVDMGVINNEGAVGIVSAVSDRFSVAIPLINTELHLSCKLKRQNYTGPLTWDGKDYRYAYLEDIAKHIEVEQGDTIVTSGYTKNFPENILVGVVDEVSTSQSDAYHRIKVRMAVNYNSISSVTIIKNNTAKEQIELEQSTK